MQCPQRKCTSNVLKLLCGDVQDEPGAKVLKQIRARLLVRCHHPKAKACACPHCLPMMVLELHTTVMQKAQRPFAREHVQPSARERGESWIKCSEDDQVTPALTVLCSASTVATIGPYRCTVTTATGVPSSILITCLSSLARDRNGALIIRI